MGALEVLQAQGDLKNINLSESSWQIMDPKMDSGFLREGETLEDEFDILKELLPEEVIGLMDQILCHEVRFAGASI